MRIAFVVAVGGSLLYCFIAFDVLLLPTYCLPTTLLLFYNISNNNKSNIYIWICLAMQINRPLKCLFGAVNGLWHIHRLFQSIGTCRCGCVLYIHVASSSRVERAECRATLGLIHICNKKTSRYPALWQITSSQVSEWDRTSQCNTYGFS